MSEANVLGRVRPMSNANALGRACPMSEANVLGIPCDFALSDNKIPIRAKVSY
jgi:hypothetical protein